MKREQFLSIMGLPFIGILVSSRKDNKKDVLVSYKQATSIKLETPCDITNAASREKLKPIVQQIESKTFTFPQLNAGDCVMQAGSSLILYSDGNAKFEAVVWTQHTHSGDTWEHIIEIQDNRGLKLFNFPKLTGPNHMNDNGTHYNFGPDWLKFDPQFYAAAQQAVPHGFC